MTLYEKLRDQLAKNPVPLTTSLRGLLLVVADHYGADPQEAETEIELALRMEGQPADWAGKDNRR